MPKIPPFVKISGSSVIYNDTGTFNLYIPERYFDLKAARYSGDYLELLGILTYCIEKNEKRGPLHDFYIPTIFMCKASDSEKLKDVSLTKNTPPQDYLVLKFSKGDPIILNTKVPMDIDNVELLINMFIITGSIPNTLSYDKLQNYIIDNMNVNGNDYNVHLQLWGFILSEICRSASDLYVPFRLSKSNDMYNYKSISVKEVSRMDSPYAALSSENFDDSIVKATLSKKESNSPLEKILINGFDDE